MQAEWDACGSKAPRARPSSKEFSGLLGNFTRFSKDFHLWSQTSLNHSTQALRSHVASEHGFFHALAEAANDLSRNLQKTNGIVPACGRLSFCPLRDSDGVLTAVFGQTRCGLCLAAPRL